MTSEINQPQRIKDLLVEKDTDFSGIELLVSGKIEIKAGSCLTLLNCKLSFADSGCIISEGKVIAAKSVFQAMSPDYGWAGIYLIGDSTDGSSFKSCSFLHANSLNSTEAGSSNGAGGAILVENAENARLTFLQCLFESCSAELGGAICFKGILESNVEPYDSSPTQLIKNCKFVGCKAQQGGAIGMIHRAKVSIENSIFENNAANSGGAIYNYDYCKLDASWCSFRNCSSTVAGGALTSRFSTNTISFSTFEKCVSDNGDAQGGALYLEKSNSRIFDSSFTRCYGQAGGAIRPIGGMLSLATINFVNCQAQAAGAAIAYSRDSESSCVNSIFDNCRLTSGSIAGEAVAVMGSALKLKNCSFMNSSSRDLAVIISALNGSDVTIEGCRAES